MIHGFLSYSHADKDIAEALATDLSALEAEGIRIWWDRFLKPGKPWNEAIRAQLRRSQIYVFLTTPNALAKKPDGTWCYVIDPELHLARHYQKKHPDAKLILIATARDAATGSHGLDKDQHIATQPRFLPTDYSSGQLQDWCASVRKGIQRAAKDIPPPRSHAPAVKNGLGRVRDAAFSLEDMTDDAEVDAETHEYTFEVCNAARTLVDKDLEDVWFEADALLHKTIELSADYATDATRSGFSNLTTELQSIVSQAEANNYPWPEDKPRAAGRSKARLSNDDPNRLAQRASIESTAEDGRAMTNVNAPGARQAGKRIEDNAKVQKALTSGKSIDTIGLGHLQETGDRIASEVWLDAVAIKENEDPLADGQLGRLREMALDARPRFEARKEQLARIESEVSPPDEKTRKQWEMDAAVAILTGQPVPPERRPHIRRLSLSARDDELRSALEVANAALDAIYVDPDAEKYQRVIRLSDLTLLQSLSSLQSLDLSDTQISDLSPLQSLSSLQELSLGGTQISDLSPLQSLSALRELYLGSTQISELTPLQSLSALQSLYLGNTQVSDLTPLQSLSALQKLYLSSTQVSDLTPLQSLSALRELYLGSTQISELTPLQSLSALQSLYLGNTQVSDFTPLQSLSSLQELSLDGTQISDLTPLQSLSALQSLSLMGTQVSDLSPLQSLSALQSLDLRSTRVSDLKPLQSHSALQSLSLMSTQVSDLKPLQSLSALQKLYLMGTQVTDWSPVDHIAHVFGRPKNWNRKS